MSNLADSINVLKKADCWVTRFDWSKTDKIKMMPPKFRDMELPFTISEYLEHFDTAIISVPRKISNINVEYTQEFPILIKIKATDLLNYTGNYTSNGILLGYKNSEAGEHIFVRTKGSCDIDFTGNCDYDGNHIEGIETIAYYLKNGLWTHIDEDGEFDSDSELVITDIPGITEEDWRKIWGEDYSNIVESEDDDLDLVDVDLFGSKVVAAFGMPCMISFNIKTDVYINYTLIWKIGNMYFGIEIGDKMLANYQHCALNRSFISTEEMLEETFGETYQFSSFLDAL